MAVITSIEDLRVIAQRRVPRMFYDYADSGSWTESTYRANSDDFQKIKLRQRVAVNMENRTTATTMVGQAVKMPVCIAPVGLTGMQSADGEIKAAKADAIARKFEAKAAVQTEKAAKYRTRAAKFLEKNKLHESESRTYGKRADNLEKAG